MKVRAIQVGLGDWGLDWASNIAPQIRDFETVGFVNRNQERAREAQSALGRPPSSFFKTMDAAVSETDPVAALILTTTVSHTNLIREALELGLHVLVEKPFTDNFQEAKELVKLAQSADRVLMVNQNFRFFPAAISAAALVRNGTIGSIDRVSVNFQRNLQRSLPQKLKWHQSMSQPLLFDLGIHHFDLMRMMLSSEADTVLTKPTTDCWRGYQDPPSATVRVTMRNGVEVDWSASWISDEVETTFSGDWVVEGSHGRIEWASRGDRDLTLDHERLSVTTKGNKAHDLELPSPALFGRAGVLDQFRLAILGRETSQFVPYAQDNLETLRLAQGVVKSYESGESVKLDELR